jgi:hypothetical protein
MVLYLRVEVLLDLTQQHRAQLLPHGFLLLLSDLLLLLSLILTFKFCDQRGQPELLLPYKQQESPLASDRSPELLILRLLDLVED